MCLCSAAGSRSFRSRIGLGDITCPDNKDAEAQRYKM